MSETLQQPDALPSVPTEAVASNPHAGSELSPAPCSDSSAWPLKDVVAKLSEAATILLDRHDYDGDGWEQIQSANDEAKKWLSQNSQLNQPA